MSRVVMLVAGEPRDLSLEIEQRFDDLASRARARFEDLDVSPEDVEGAIEWARGSS